MEKQTKEESFLITANPCCVPLSNLPPRIVITHGSTERREEERREEKERKERERKRERERESSGASLIYINEGH